METLLRIAWTECSRSSGTGAQDPVDYAFDAQQLGDAPALLVALGSRKRLVDYREPFGSFTVTTESVRNLGEKWRVKHGKQVLGFAGERAAQKLQPGANVAALDAQHGCETSTHDVPQLQRVPGGKLQKRLNIALRQGQIADVKCDGAGCIKQGTGQRPRVIAGAGIDDLAFDATHGLVGKSLQPEYEAVIRMRRQPLVVMKPNNDVRPPGDIAT